MAEDDACVAAFKEFREEFVSCVNVIDIILALGKTLTNTDEGQIRAVYKTEGNRPAALHLCECLFRRPNWKENIVKALRSYNIGQDDLADRIEEKFRTINSNCTSSSDGSVSISNVKEDIPVQWPQTPQGTPSMVVINVYNEGARPKIIVPPTSSSAGRILTTNILDAAPTVPEKDMNIIPLKKYEEHLVAGALDDKQWNVLIIVPAGDETRSRVPVHICTTHLQTNPEDGVRKHKAICLTTTSRINWFVSLKKYMPGTIKIESILDDQKNITAKSLKNSDVMLSTPEIFEKALNSKALAFKDITLLILDECHLTCQSGHPYRSIMKSYFKEKLAANSAMAKVVGLATRSNLQNQKDVKEAADNLSNLMGTLDAMCISAVTGENTKELYKQIYPKISQISIFERCQDNTFCSVISEMMLEIEQKLDISTLPLKRHSEEYGYHIAELSEEEKEKQKDQKIRNKRSVLLKYLAIYNEVLQINEMMRTKDAFELLKKFYRENNDDEWLDDLYQEHLSELHKLSKEGDSKYENPRLAHLKREILAKSGGDFKAIIVCEYRQVRETLYNWLKSPGFKNLTTFSINDIGEIENFNADQRLLLISSTELKDAKVTGVKMAVIFGSTKDGIHIFQSDDDVTQELLGLVAELQFNEVVKRLQDLPESVKQESNLNKKLQILGESREIKEQNISEKNLSQNMVADGLKIVKEVKGKGILFDKDVRGHTSDGGTSSSASGVNIKSKVFTEKEKCSSDNASAILKGSIQLTPSKSCKADVNASSHSKKIENQSWLSEFKLYCRGYIDNKKCNAFVCSLSDIRIISKTNHVYNKLCWNWSKIDVKEHHDEEKRRCNTKKIYCKACGADWGNTCKDYPCFKLKSIIVRLPNGKWRPFSEWKSFGVSIPPMEYQ